MARSKRQATAPTPPAPLAPFVSPELDAWNASMRALDVTLFEPLIIRCTVDAPICMPTKTLALDGLVAAAVARRTGQPPAASAAECAPIEIPIMRETRGRFHLASGAQFAVDVRARSYTNRRFPTHEAQNIGCAKTMRRILVTAGSTKAFRLPREHLHLQHDEVAWFCIGDSDALLDLLHDITALGKRRAVGLGALVPGSWRVEPIEPWDGFPVLRDGVPLRPLPLDWPGLVTYEPGYARLTYPYWDRPNEALCATPPTQM